MRALRLRQLRSPFMRVVDGEDYRRAWERMLRDDDLNDADRRTLHAGQLEAGYQGNRYPLPACAEPEPEPQRATELATAVPARATRWSRWQRPEPERDRGPRRRG